MIWCSSRLLLRRHLLDAHRRHRDFVRRVVLQDKQHDGHRDDHGGSGAGDDQGRDEGDVNQPEQEHGEDHARLQAAVLAEAALRVCH